MLGVDIIGRQGTHDSYLRTWGKGLGLSNEWPFQLPLDTPHSDWSTMHLLFKHYNSVTKGSDSVVQLYYTDTSRLMSTIRRPVVYYLHPHDLYMPPEIKDIHVFKYLDTVLLLCGYDAFSKAKQAGNSSKAVLFPISLNCALHQEFSEHISSSTHARD